MYINAIYASPQQIQQSRVRHVLSARRRRSMSECAFRLHALLEIRCRRHARSRPRSRRPCALVLAPLPFPLERTADESEKQQQGGAQSGRHQEIHDDDLQRLEGIATSDNCVQPLNQRVDDQDSSYLARELYDAQPGFVSGPHGLLQFGRTDEVHNNEDDDEAAIEYRKQERMAEKCQSNVDDRGHRRKRRHEGHGVSAQVRPSTRQLLCTARDLDPPVGGSRGRK